MREYSTQMEAAKKGIITPEMKAVAEKEYMEPEKLRELVAQGVVAIPCNVRHTSISPEGIGMGLRTKINVIRQNKHLPPRADRKISRDDRNRSDVRRDRLS